MINVPFGKMQGDRMRAVFIIIMVIIIMGGFIMITGCSNREISGTVVDREHQPESEQIHLQPMVVGKITMLMPMVIHDDEDWLLQIKYYHTRKNEYKTRWIYVTEQEYSLYMNGDTYSTLKSDMLVDRDTSRKATSEDQEKYGDGS